MIVVTVVLQLVVDLELQQEQATNSVMDLHSLLVTQVLVVQLLD